LVKQHASAALTTAYGTTDVSYSQAYAVFKTLSDLAQREFLNQVYFNELNETADKNGPTFHQYSRGYEAVNALFPASLGYTANSLDGGTNGANTMVETGNLDLRLATIQTEWGGDIDIFGPGGRVIAGSTVRTDAQAARRTFSGRRLFSGYSTEFSSIPPAAISAIPSGYEGVLTLRGGAISTFTDGDFLLNQSRLFTEQGGPMIMWSSNADLNAGKGPKTSANFPPVLVKVDQNGFVQTDQVGATTGAGIAALQATPDTPPSDVSLIAPRGTVDAELPACVSPAISTWRHCRFSTPRISRCRAPPPASRRCRYRPSRRSPARQTPRRRRSRLVCRRKPITTSPPSSSSRWSAMAAAMASNLRSRRMNGAGMTTAVKVTMKIVGFRLSALVAQRRREGPVDRIRTEQTD